MSKSTLPAETAALREQATDDRTHRRTPGIIADLAVGLRYFLRFSVECGAITDAEEQALWERCWTALLEVHHIRALRDLNVKGQREKPKWVQIMAARKRKTLVVCRTCHVDIHHGRSNPQRQT